MCARIKIIYPMKRSDSLILCSLLLAACAQAPQRPESPAAPAPVASTELKAEAELKLPNITLTDELLYEYLLTEIASQRGYKTLAAEGGADLAKKTHDPRLARRAAQLAFESGDMKRAIEALRQWRSEE